jgi:MFS family permease
MTPSRRGWPLIAALFTTEVLLMGSGYNTIGVFFNPLMQHFHRNHAQVSMLATLFSVTIAIGALVAGWLFETFSARLIMAGGGIACWIALVIASQAHSFSTIAFSYFLLGTGMSLTTIAALAVVIGRSFDTSERGTALGLAMSGNGAGGFLMIPVASLAVAHLGWRGGYLVLAAPMLLVAVPLFLIFVPPLHKSAKSKAAVDQSDGLELREAIRSRSLWLILLLTFMFDFALVIPLIHLIPYLIHLGYKPERAATAMGTIQGITCLGTVVWGTLIDRFGARAMMMICLLITATSLAILLGAGNVLFLLAFILMFGFILNAITALLPCLLTEALGMRRYSLFVGISRFMASSASALGPLTAGWLVDLTGEYSAAIVVAVVSVCCAFGFSAALPRARYRLNAIPAHAV